MGEAPVDVAVVGGGVTGGAAACAFASRGARVRLFERRDLTRDPNRGDALEPATMRALEEIGAMPALDRRGARWARQIIFTDGAERRSARRELGPNARFVLNHAEIEAALLEAATGHGAEACWEAVRSVRREGGAWMIETAGGVHRARLLVGADGHRSLVRQAAGIEFPGHDYDHAVVILHAETPSWMADDAAWMIHHRRGGVILLPTTPAGRCRLVVTVPRDEAAGWLKGSDAERLAILGAPSSRLSDLRLVRVGGSHVYQVERRHAARYVGEGLALAGDAAHVTHPMGGWGMNIAIRDAAALAALAAPAVRGGDAEALQAALRRYEHGQRPRNARILRAAHLWAKLMAPGPVGYQVGLAILGILARARPSGPLPLLR